MFMHDHEKPRDWEEWCPLMREICRKGKTASMPEGSRCKAWQPVTVNDPRATPPQHDVYDCAVYGWPPDLMVQVANETYSGAQATEQVRNKVAEQNGMSQIALAFFQALAKRFGARPVFPDLSKREGIEHQQNGKGAS